MLLSSTGAVQQACMSGSASRFAMHAVISVSAPSARPDSSRRALLNLCGNTVTDQLCIPLPASFWAPGGTCDSRPHLSPSAAWPLYLQPFLQVRRPAVKGLEPHTNMRQNRHWAESICWWCSASQASIGIQTHTYLTHRHPFDVSNSLQTRWASSVTGAPLFHPQLNSCDARFESAWALHRNPCDKRSCSHPPYSALLPPYNTLPCPRPPCPHLPRPHLPSCFPALSLRVDKGFVAQTADVMSRTLPMTPEQKVRHGHGHTMQEAPLHALLLRPVASCVTVTGNPQVTTVCCVTAAPSAQLALSPRLALVASCCVAVSCMCHSKSCS